MNDIFVSKYAELHPVVIVLIVMNVAVFITSLIVGTTCVGNNCANTLIVEGSTWGARISEGDWWRIITGGFLHHGLLHLLINMYVLVILGKEVGRMFGATQLTAIYGASLLSGSFGALIETPNGLVAGSSGAIFGLLGAVTAYAISHRIGLFETPIGAILLLNLVIGILFDQISLGGHIGGFVGGFLIAWITLKAAETKTQMNSAYLIATVFVGGVSTVGCFLVTG